MWCLHVHFGKIYVPIQVLHNQKFLCNLSIQRLRAKRKKLTPSTFETIICIPGNLCLRTSRAEMVIKSDAAVFHWVHFIISKAFIVRFNSRFMQVLWKYRDGLTRTRWGKTEHPCWGVTDSADASTFQSRLLGKCHRDECSRVSGLCNLTAKAIRSSTLDFLLFFIPSKQSAVPFCPNQHFFNFVSHSY